MLLPFPQPWDSEIHYKLLLPSSWWILSKLPSTKTLNDEAEQDGALRSEGCTTMFLCPSDLLCALDKEVATDP